MQLNKILVVDDEPSIADTLAVILKQNGCEVRVAYSGQQAVDLACDMQPDLVVSDVVMPGKDGIEVAMELRAKLPRCKILLFSGQAATAERLQEARQRGQEWKILPKPVHPHDLLAKLRDLGR